MNASNLVAFQNLWRLPSHWAVSHLCPASAEYFYWLHWIVSRMTSRSNSELGFLIPRLLSLIVMKPSLSNLPLQACPCHRAANHLKKNRWGYVTKEHLNVAYPLFQVSNALNNTLVYLSEIKRLATHGNDSFWAISKRKRKKKKRKRSSEHLYAATSI